MICETNLEQHPDKVSVNEVWVVAASIAHYRQTPLDKLIGWNLTFVFTQHYLRDMVIDNDFESIPMVAAGTAETLFGTNEQVWSLF